MMLIAAASIFASLLPTSVSCQDLFTANGITQVETNPELEENKAIQQLWKKYDHQLHKRRRTYKRDL